jgi:enediyne biosynthesis protein CalE5
MMIKDKSYLCGLLLHDTSSSSPSSSSFDSEQFKLRQSWDIVSTGWKEWWETVEIAAQKVSDRLIELAEIKPGQKVLDIATRIGEPALTAARKLVELASSSYDKKSDDDNNRNRGHVLATDISTQMLTIAKQSCSRRIARCNRPRTNLYMLFHHK